VPQSYKIFSVPHNRVVIRCDTSQASVCPDARGQPAGPVGRSFYLFLHDLAHGVPQLTGTDLHLKGTRQDFDPTTSEPIVLMQFTHKGASKFHDVTREEAHRGASKGTPQHFAIVLDREIRSFPQIDYSENPDGIEGSNGAQITGINSVKEAKDLALVLQSGALPYNFQQIERADVSATLGKDSLQEAKKAAAGGLIVVAIFLLVLYRFLGLIAVLPASRASS
jgi:SecD/SecF fusion protein